MPSDVDLHLSPADLGNIRTELTAESERLLRSISVSRHEEVEVREDVAGHDEIDDIVSSLDSQRSANEASEASLRLESVTAALRRIEDGSYGQCVVCDEPIARGRLLALPTAIRCIRCQSRRPHRRF